jgi:hypothetical protein
MWNYWNVKMNTLKHKLLNTKISRKCWRNNWYVNKTNCEIRTKPFDFIEYKFDKEINAHKWINLAKIVIEINTIYNKLQKNSKLILQMDQQLNLFIKKFDVNLKWAIAELKSVKTHVNKKKIIIIE